MSGQLPRPERATALWAVSLRAKRGNPGFLEFGAAPTIILTLGAVRPKLHINSPLGGEYRRSRGWRSKKQ